MDIGGVKQGQTDRLSLDLERVSAPHLGPGAAAQTHHRNGYKRTCRCSEEGGAHVAVRVALQAPASKAHGLGSLP